MERFALRTQLYQLAKVFFRVCYHDPSIKIILGPINYALTLKDF